MIFNDSKPPCLTSTTLLFFKALLAYPWNLSSIFVIDYEWLLVHGSGLMPQASSANFFLAVSLEPWASRPEPWALSHEPLIIDQSLNYSIFYFRFQVLAETWPHRHVAWCVCSVATRSQIELVYKKQISDSMDELVCKEVGAADAYGQSPVHTALDTLVKLRAVSPCISIGLGQSPWAIITTAARHT